MFGLFKRSPRVECVEHDEGRLMFRSDELPAVGREQKVELTVAAPSGGEQTIAVRVAVNGARPLENGGYLCTASAEGLPSVRPVGVDDPSLRRRPRTECAHRIRCLDVPGHLLQGVDVSSGGMQLRVGGRVEVGSVLHMELDPPSGGPSLPFDARVAWSSGALDTGFRMGVEFQSIPSETLERLLPR